jgi:thymidylate synthase (FAD)
MSDDATAEPDATESDGGLPPEGRFVTEPRVFVVGVQVLVLPPVFEFTDSIGHPNWWYRGRRDDDASSDLLCEIAGRVCYRSFGKSTRDHKRYLAHIKESRHGSVLEHAVMSFIVSGVSRSLTHELVRHRAGWSYSMLSQRFTDESNARFVIPPDYLGKPALRDRFKLAMAAALRLYRQLRDDLTSIQDEPARPSSMPEVSTIQRKIRNGAARSALPNATETIVFCTVNARALRHFLERRASPDADDEIRRFAMLLYREALHVMPEILSDYEVRTCERGLEWLHTDHPKV